MLIDYERERRNNAKRLKAEGRRESEGMDGESREKRGEKRGERRMGALKDRCFVLALLKSTSFDDQKIAFLTGVAESFVRQERRLLSHSH